MIATFRLIRLKIKPMHNFAQILKINEIAIDIELNVVNMCLVGMVALVTLTRNFTQCYLTP